MAPCPDLVAQIMARDSEHTLTDQPMVGIGPVRGQGTESLCLCHGGTTPPADAVDGPQLPNRPQPVLGIIKPFRKLESLCPGRLQLGRGPSGVRQGCRKCCIKLHPAGRVPIPSGCVVSAPSPPKPSGTRATAGCKS